MKKTLLTFGLLIGFMGAAHAEMQDLPVLKSDSAVFLKIKNELPPQVVKDFEDAQQSLYDKGVMIGEEVLKELVGAITVSNGAVDDQKMYDMLCVQLFNVINSSNDNVESLKTLLKKPENIKALQGFLNETKADVTKMSDQCKETKAKMSKNTKK